MQGDRPRAAGAEAAEKVLEAAARLLSSGGVDAVSTRAVAAAAGVQPPTIYRQFGDKQ
jgi:AcrR family transcriptional regulator